MPREVQDVVTFEEIRRACASPENRCVVLKFGARWCGPCKIVAPIVTQWLEEAPQGVAILSVDADDAEPLLDQFCIQKVPTFVLLHKDGSIAARLQTCDFAKVKLEIMAQLERSADVDEF